MIPKWNHYFLLFVKEILQTMKKQILNKKERCDGQRLKIRTFYFHHETDEAKNSSFLRLFHARIHFSYFWRSFSLRLFILLLPFGIVSGSVRTQIDNFVKYFRSTLRDLSLLTTSYFNHFHILRLGFIFSIRLMRLGVKEFLNVCGVAQ